MVSKYFGMYEEFKTEKTRDRKLKIKKVEVGLEQLVNYFETDFIKLMKDKNLGYYFETVLLDLKKMDYNTIAIEQFCLKTKDYQDNKELFENIFKFIYVSIYNIAEKDNKIILDFSKLEKKPSFIGYGLEHDIELIIKGDNMDKVGAFMHRGKIILEGNAGEDVGHGMYGGELIVKGDAGDYVGRGMSNKSQLIIKGSARNYAGKAMSGGELIIEKNCAHCLGLHMSNGKILVKEDAGDYAGKSMLDGKITVIKNAGYWTGGGMNGGNITINGCVKSKAGGFMEGGILNIYGNAESHVGYIMKNGRINLYGDKISLAHKIDGGEIYHQGFKIWPE